MAFTGRIRTYHAWKQADADLARQRSTHDRNRAQGKIPNDRLGYAMTQLAEAERRRAGSDDTPRPDAGALPEPVANIAQ